MRKQRREMETGLYSLARTCEVGNVSDIGDIVMIVDVSKCRIWGNLGFSPGFALSSSWSKLYLHLCAHLRMSDSNSST